MKRYILNGIKKRKVVFSLIVAMISIVFIVFFVYYTQSDESETVENVNGSIGHETSYNKVETSEPTVSLEPQKETSPEPSVSVEPQKEASPEPSASVEPQNDVTPEPSIIVEPQKEVTPEPTKSPETDKEVTLKPTVKPTIKPTAKPTAKPTPKPTPKPTAKPTPMPTPKPTAKPTPKPTQKVEVETQTPEEKQAAIEEALKVYDVVLSEDQIKSEIKSKLSLISKTMKYNKENNDPFNINLLYCVEYYCKTGNEFTELVNVTSMKGEDWLRVVCFWLFERPKEEFDWTMRDSYKKIYNKLMKKAIYNHDMSNIKITNLEVKTSGSYDGHSLSLQVNFVSNNKKYVAYFTNNGEKFILLDIALL